MRNKMETARNMVVSRIALATVLMLIYTNAPAQDIDINNGIFYHDMC
jgi:hypothetical protein